MLFASLLAGASLAVGSGFSLRCALAVFLGLSLVRVVLIFPVPESYDILLISAIWVIVASLIPRKVVCGDWEAKKTALLIRVLIVLNGATGLWAKLVDAPRTVGSLPYLAGDLLLISAMLLIGWSLRNDFICGISHNRVRGSRMVGDSIVRDRGFAGGWGDLAQHQENTEMRQQKVTSNG